MSRAGREVWSDFARILEAELTSIPYHCKLVSMQDYQGRRARDGQSGLHHRQVKELSDCQARERDKSSAAERCRALASELSSACAGEQVMHVGSIKISHDAILAVRSGSMQLYGRS